MLLPALAAVAAQTRRPLALVEIGTSAGLLLNYDHYRYSYGSHGVGPESPVRLHCELRGRDPAVTAVPAATAKVGIDLNPIDATDPDEALWLAALLWPEQQRRRERLLVRSRRDQQRAGGVRAEQQLQQGIQRRHHRRLLGIGLHRRLGRRR